MRPALFLCIALPLMAADDTVVKGMNQFAVAAYKQLAKGDANLIYSPFNIGSALSMTLAGARADTATEIAKVLGQSPLAPGYHADLARTVEELTKASNSSGNQLLNANALWVEREFPLLPQFKQTLQTHYQAPPTLVDFVKNLEGTRQQINTWTEKKTNGKITDLFAPGVLTADTRLVLTSAIYFYGKWQSQFKAHNTHAMPFYSSTGTVIADFMNQTFRFGYADTPSLQVLEMRYEGSGLAMDILLPKEKEGLLEVEKGLTPENLSSWLSGLENKEVDATIPKFRVESKFGLKETLSAMGMPTAFDSSKADFSGMDGRRDLYVSAVVHKAFVDVAEQGTEAAAATGTVMSLTSMMTEPKTVFRADHPFAFVIRDTKSGLILFAGRVVNPKR